MSGQQIGSFVGGVIGGVFGGQFGYAIGSAIGGAIGGAIDPSVIKGPRLTDGMSQTVSDGAPIPWGLGTFPTAGNIVWAGELVERKHEDDGKGSGTVQVTYTYHRSYAILICQGIRRADGTYEPIAGIMQVKRDGKVVYDVSPGVTSEQNAQNAKFLRNHSFVLGSEDQLPSSVVEAELGVGNAPAYPGSVIMYAENVDCTDLRGAISQYEFVVSTAGEASTTQETTYHSVLIGEFADQDYPLTSPSDGYTYDWFVMIGTGQIASGSASSISQCQIDASAAVPGTTYLRYIGYSAGSPDFVGTSNTAEQASVVGAAALTLLYSATDDVDWTQVPVSNMCTVLTDNGRYYGSFEGYPVRITGEGSAARPGEQLVGNCGAGTQVFGLPVLWINVTAVEYCGDCDIITPIPDAPGWGIGSDGEVAPLCDGEVISGSFHALQAVDGRPIMDPVVILGSENAAFWNSAAAAAGVSGSYPDDFPQIATRACRSQSTTELLDREPIPLATIVAEVCNRSGLVEADYDVSQLTDLVDGFKVATEASGESIIAPLMHAYFFDAAEYDDKIRFVKRGGDVVAELTSDDLCESDGDVIEETEVQEAELLRKVHVKTIDPEAGFTVTTQTAERRTSTVLAKGEQTVEIPVVTDKDTQARIADKKLKVGWAEVRKFKTAIPYTHPELTVTDRIGLTDRKGKRSRIRLMEMAEDSGRIEISEAMLDRQAAYTSSVQGVVHEPPTTTSPGLIGPTFGVAMNLPSLRTQDNVPGAYVAACGYLSGWTGCALLLSADGGLSYQQVATFDQPSSMGILKSAATASSEPLEVFMRSGTLSSITAEQMDARQNAFAITTDGTSELGQFQTATQDSSGTYLLTDTVRGGLGTTALPHSAGDPFVMVATAKFLPLDMSLVDKTLYLKFVSYGTSPDDAEAVPFVFRPMFVSVNIENLTVSGEKITVDGNPIFVVTQNA